MLQSMGSQSDMTQQLHNKYSRKITVLLFNPHSNCIRDEDCCLHCTEEELRSQRHKMIC